MNKIKRFLLLDSFGETLSENDLVSKQRFRLFKITTIFSLITYLAFLYQVSDAHLGNPTVLYIISFLFICLFINYFGVPVHKKQKLSYMALVMILFTLLHVISYYEGGVRNSGMFYLAAMIFIAYMLLGSKGGKAMAVISMIHITYFYFVNRNTNWVNYALIGDDPALIDLDFFITGAISVLVLTAQSGYLEKTKNAIIADIISKKNELAVKNNELADYAHDLEKTNKELDKFAYVVSHDLKAPLRAIGNLTGWIEEDVGTSLPDSVMKNFNIIKGRVVRMEALINGILDYSKAGKNKGQYVSFDSKTLLKETYDLLGAPDNCSIEISADMPVLHSDKIKLQQIFMNLVNNAIKYNDKQEIRIKVDAAEEKKFWHFTITDNGPGIEKQFHDKIFVIFQTLNARDEVESTGVGLAIVKKIIEDQGGQIWVESEKGHGAAFHFTWAKANINTEDISKAEFVSV